VIEDGKGTMVNVSTDAGDTVDKPDMDRVMAKENVQSQKRGKKRPRDENEGPIVLEKTKKPRIGGRTGGSKKKKDTKISQEFIEDSDILPGEYEEPVEDSRTAMDNSITME
jgi:hypothetical protein